MRPETSSSPPPSTTTTPFGSTNLEAFPSMAPGLRWWQRLRLRYCAINSECRWTWIMSIILVLYLLVIHYCIGLLVRFVFHLCLLGSSMVVLGYSYASVLLYRRLEQADAMSARRAKVIRTKTIPNSPIPNLPQKIFCWLELLLPTEEDDNNNEFLLAVNDGIERRASTTGDDAAHEDNQEQNEDDGQDDRDWMHVPCVIAQELDSKGITSSPSTKIRKGDILTVRLIDGDVKRLIFVPYQKHALQRMKALVYKWLVYGAVSVVALVFIFRGIPIVFANSQVLEDLFNDWAAKIDVWLDNALSFLDDDDQNNDDNADETNELPACRIPWFVAMGYDALLFFTVVAPIAVMFFVIWQKKKELGAFEEAAPTDTYHLLQGGEEEGTDEPENSSSPAGTEEGASDSGVELSSPSPTVSPIV